MAEENNSIESSNKAIIEDDEIDLIQVAKTILEGRKFILKVILVFFLLGLLIAFTSKMEYQASCKLMAESLEGSKSSLGGLGGLAGLAGINLDAMGSSGALTPDIYPQIAESVPFLLKTWNQPLHFERQDTVVSSYIFLKELDNSSFLNSIYKYTIRLPYTIKRLFSRENQSIKINDDENQIIRLDIIDTWLLEKFKSRIDVYVDSKSGIIFVSSEMPDALAAAELTEISVRFLTEYITDYKISKAQQNLDFILARYIETKESFDRTQRALAVFNDQNRNVVTAQAQTEQLRLLNENNIAFEVFKGLAGQLEQAKLKVKEETPVFTVLEPVSVPVYKSKPKRLLILTLSIILGIVAGISILFLKNILRRFKSSWHN